MKPKVECGAIITRSIFTREGKIAGIFCEYKLW